MSCPEDNLASFHLRDISKSTDDYMNGVSMNGSAGNQWGYGTYESSHSHKLNPQELLVPIDDENGYDDFDMGDQNGVYSHYKETISPTKHIRSSQYGDSMSKSPSTAEILDLMKNDQYMFSSGDGMGVKAQSLTNLNLLGKGTNYKMSQSSHSKGLSSSSKTDGRIQLSSMGYRSQSVSNFQSNDHNSLFADGVNLGGPCADAQLDRKHWDGVGSMKLKYKVNENRGFSSLYPASTGNLGGLIGSGNRDSTHPQYGIKRSQYETDHSWDEHDSPLNSHDSLSQHCTVNGRISTTKANLSSNRSDTDLVASFNKMMGIGLNRNQAQSPNNSSLDVGLQSNPALTVLKGPLDEGNILEHLIPDDPDVSQLQTESSSSISNLSNSDINCHQGFGPSKVHSISPSGNPSFSLAQMNAQYYAGSQNDSRYDGKNVPRTKQPNPKQFQPSHLNPPRTQGKSFERRQQQLGQSVPPSSNFNLRNNDFESNMSSGFAGMPGYVNMLGMAVEPSTQHLQNLYAQDQIALYNALLMSQSMAAGLRFPGMMMPGLNAPNLSVLEMAHLVATAQAQMAAAGGRLNYGGIYGGFERRERESLGNIIDERDPRLHIMEDPGDGNMYQVRFKRGVRTFLLARSCRRDLKVGDYVKVEADRGEDLGVVVSISAIPESATSAKLPTAGHRQKLTGAAQCERERILRAANEEELETVKENMIEEEKVLAVCREKVTQRGLPMEVTDAEYQHDRHKLTFFFRAEGRIDFRELVRDLFAIYKTRIWMQQVDSSHITTPMPIPCCNKKESNMKSFPPAASNSSDDTVQLNLTDQSLVPEDATATREGDESSEASTKTS